MSKAFWKGFREGYVEAFKYTAPIAFIIMALLYYFHPYERCKRMYDNQNDISECTWILENE